MPGSAGTSFPGKRRSGSGGREGPCRGREGGREEERRRAVSGTARGSGSGVALPPCPGPCSSLSQRGDGKEGEKLTKPTQGSARNGGEGKGKGFLPLQHPLGEKWGNVLFV